MKDAKSRERGTLEDVVPRNLQLLVIDDKEIDPLKIYTNIDPIYIPIRPDQIWCRGSPGRLQVLAPLERGRTVEFDLLSIDVKFHHDTSDVPYFHEYVQGRPDEDQPNPMAGLMAGMIMTLRRANSRLPVCIAVHSFDSKSVKDDPVAIYSYGVLKALRPSFRRRDSEPQSLATGRRNARSSTCGRLQRSSEAIAACVPPAFV